MTQFAPPSLGSTVELLSSREAGPEGAVQIVRRRNPDAPIVLDVLIDPDRYVPEPMKESQERKAKARRAVHSFPARIDGAEVRLYLKLYRVRTLKDVLEEGLLGRRGPRAFHNGIEAERRGIATPLHLGTSTGTGGAHIPKRSVLLTVGVPHHRDARTLLDHELPPSSRERHLLLRELGRFLGDVHRRGLIHTDLKLGNVFLIDEGERPRFTVIDLDRAHYQAADGRFGLRQRLDVRRLLRSSRRSLTPHDMRRLLVSYYEGRGIARARRRRGRWLFPVIPRGRSTF